MGSSAPAWAIAEHAKALRERKVPHGTPLVTEEVQALVKGGAYAVVNWRTGELLGSHADHRQADRPGAAPRPQGPHPSPHDLAATRPRRPTMIEADLKKGMNDADHPELAKFLQADVGTGAAAPRADDDDHGEDPTGGLG